MGHRVYIGIDNGTTGTVGWVGDGIHPTIIESPRIVQQAYTKKSKNVTRIDHVRMSELFRELVGDGDASDVMVVMERPFTNSKFPSAVVSAARTFEVTQVLVEQAHLPHMFVDSRDWQKVMLPTGIKGSDNLKRASKDIGLRLFPDQEKVIRKHKDADALLIAEWARRQNL